MASEARPLIIIQAISTIWTPKSRGGPDAGRQYRTPEVAPLPYLLSEKDNVFWLHKISYYESDGFQLPRGSWLARPYTYQSSDPLRHDCFKLVASKQELTLTMQWENLYGVPRRFVQLRQAFSLQTGQWGRVIYNFRTSGEDGWYYEKRIFNIAFVNDITPGVFLEKKPAHTYKSIAKLW